MLELTSEIIEYCRSESGSLFSVAMTCRLFAEVSLPLLWRTMDSAEQALAIIPPGVFPPADSDVEVSALIRKSYTLMHQYCSHTCHGFTGRLGDHFARSSQKIWLERVDISIGFENFNLAQLLAACPNDVIRC